MRYATRAVPIEHVRVWSLNHMLTFTSRCFIRSWCPKMSVSWSRDSYATWFPF